MRRGGRGEERDTTTHLIKIQVLPTLVALLNLANYDAIFKTAEKLGVSTCTTK